MAIGIPSRAHGRVDAEVAEGEGHDEGEREADDRVGPQLGGGHVVAARADEDGRERGHHDAQPRALRADPYKQGLALATGER